MSTEDEVYPFNTLMKTWKHTVSPHEIPAKSPIVSRVKSPDQSERASIRRREFNREYITTSNGVIHRGFQWKST